MSTETLTAPAPAEPRTPIKPSEALRLGRLLRPIRSTSVFFRGDDAACAIGAMFVAIGGSPDAHANDIVDVIAARWPELDAFGVAVRSDDGMPDDEIVAWLESLGL